MISGVPEREIIQCATETVREHRFTALPVDPKRIAQEHEIKLMPWKPEKVGISGFLMKVGDDFGIGYSTAIENVGFINFTVAHELGHYFLSGHIQSVIGTGNGTHYSSSGFVSDEIHEREADLFAAELLMPGHFFRSALQDAGVGFQAIQRLAEVARTSIVATAIRFAKFCDDPTAVILSSGSQIEWCFLSKELRACLGVYQFARKSALPLASGTVEFNRDARRIERCDRQESSCSLADWFERAPDVEINEDVVGLGHYGKTLTVLFADELPSEDDDSEEEADSGLPSSRWRARDQRRDN